MPCEVKKLHAVFLLGQLKKGRTIGGTVNVLVGLNEISCCTSGHIRLWRGDYMNQDYEEMMRIYNSEGRVMVATEVAPSCGLKYIGKKAADIGFGEPEKIPFFCQKGNQIFFVEEYAGLPNLIIVGGGHISLAVAKIGVLLGFRISVLDDRLEFCNTERFPEVDQILCMDIEAGLQTEFGPNSYYVIVTRGHKDDKRALEAVLLKQDYRYIGMIGSKGKVAITMKNLREQGCSEEILERVHAPIGLSIGAITPAEIAISIMAEIVEVMNRQVSDKNQINVMKEISLLKEPFVITTIIEKKGSSPRGIGSKMVVTKSGRRMGTIGGGAIEYAVIKRASEIMGSDSSEIRAYDLSIEDASDLGMICGGSVRILFESVG